MFDSLRQGLILRARLASDFLQSSCLTLLVVELQVGTIIPHPVVLKIAIRLPLLFT